MNAHLGGSAVRIIESAERSVNRSACDSREDLLCRMAQGDAVAFSNFYDELKIRVLGTVRGVLVDLAQSEEVTQEIFVEVWQNAEKFNPAQGSALSWLLMIARRRAIDRVRASQADRNRDLRIGIRDLDVSFDSVAERVEASIEYDRVHAAMATLPEMQRQSIALAYSGGYSHRDLAALLGIPLGTVKTRLRDGLTALRREMPSQ